MKKKKRVKAKAHSTKKRPIKESPVKKIKVKEQVKEEKVQDKVIGMNYEETLAKCRLAEINPDPTNPDAVRILINLENINDSEIEYLWVEGTIQRWEVLSLDFGRPVPYENCH